MKKVIIMILSIIFTSGCTVQLFDKQDYQSIVNLISNNTPLSNQNGHGYRFYLPNNISSIETIDYNHKFYTNFKTYYFYVDVISYFYRLEENHLEDNNSYYYQELNFGDKKGYIEILDINDKHHIKLSYNYAKIEAIVEKNAIKETIFDMIQIVNSVKYNDAVIENILKNKTFSTTDQTFKFFNEQTTNVNYLDYIEEYDKFDDTEDELPDEDLIKKEE